MARLRIAVMGCASIARRRMLPAMTAHDGIDVVAVASRDAGRAGAVAAEYGCRPVTGYQNLLHRPDVDAVYVPLPLSLHASWVEAALLAGKHVLAEKPVTADPVTTGRLLDLADRQGLVLMENVMFVHHPQHAAVARLVDEGAIGRLRALHARFTVPALPDDDIRYDPELGDGVLSDVGLYPVRAALHLLGHELSVAGVVLSAGPGRRVPTSGAALLVRPDGVTAQLNFGLEHAYSGSYEVHGSTGRIVVDRAYTPPADHVPVLLLDRAGRVEQIRLDAHDQVAGSLTAFAAAVRAGAASPASVAACRRQSELLGEIAFQAQPVLA